MPISYISFPQDVLPSRKVRPNLFFSVNGISPDEVWLADGDLLVLKGGTTNNDGSGKYDNPWPPLDDFQVKFNNKRGN